MSYVQTVLADRPAGFWMITAPSGTSETDLSGNGKTATITEATDLIDRAYRPLVTGTDTDCAYRMYSSNHQVTYPAMEAWEASRNHIPFSIEMTFQPIDCTSTREAILFAPQAASSAYVMDNGLYCVNNTLRFVVSNGSDTTPATSKSVVQKYLEPGRTYHVVAVYDVSKIKLYVDNVLVDTAEVPAGIGWSHTTANFVTMSNRPTAVTTEVCNFIFDAVSFYRQALSPESINNHYFMSTPNISDVDLVNSLGGKIIKINDEDRVKSFNWSGADRGWNSDSIELTDCVINDDGSVGLKKIPPVELRTTPKYYGNMLTWNQASIEVDTTGLQAIARCTISRTTASALHGQGSLLLTCNSTGRTAGGTSTALPVPVTPGKVYTGVASGRIATGTNQTVQVALRWLDESKNLTISEVGGDHPNATNAGWVQSYVTATAPDNAAYVSVYLTFESGISGETYYVDQFGIWEGSSTTWVPPNPYRLPLGENVSDYPKNLVPTPVSLVEGGINGWASGTNCTATYDATRMNDLGGSVKMTGTAAGYMQTYNGAVFGIVPGQKYTAVSHTLAETAPALARTDIYWYLQGGGSAGSTIGSTTTNSTTAWTKTSVTGIAPANAVSARVGVQINSGGAGHIHYMDGAGLFAGGNTTMYEGAYNTDEINLRDSMFVKVRDAGKHVGKNQGGFGFFADVTATQNDHIQEQCLASISNTAGDSVIEIVKKTDKSLYLRYKYLNTAGDLTTVEDSWGAISSLLATNAYFYVEWGAGLLRLYVNSTATPAEIAFDNGIKAPRFDENSYLNLGAGADELRPWNNLFKWLKLYDSAQGLENFLLNRSSVNGFTAKLGSSLNVSQTGSVTIQAAVPDSTETIDQTRITWEPQSSGITVKTSPSGITNLLTYNQATIEIDTTGINTSRGTILKSVAVAPAQGVASLEYTVTDASSAGYVFTAQGTSGIPCKANTQYTVVGSVTRGAAVPTSYRPAYVGVYWYDSAGGLISTEAGTSSDIALSGSWGQKEGTFTSPANASFVTAFFYFGTGRLVGEKYYLDQWGISEGTSTTWTEPLQTAFYGTEIVANQFPTVPPNTYFSVATLSTDDSYYSPTTLYDLRLEAFSDGTQYGENSFDQLVGSTCDRAYGMNVPAITQPLFNGGYVNNQKNAFYIYPIDDTTDTSIPSGGSGSTTAGPASQIRTLEFWLYPEAQGYYVYHDGTTEYSMRYYDSGGFTTTGFTTLYVDGTVQANASTLTTWYGRWHHIVLTNASAQITINTDAPAGVNLLTANQASIETDMTGLIFGGGGSNAAVRTTAHSLHGGASVAVTTSNANQSGVYTGNTLGSKTPVTPGKTYTAVGWVKADTVPRNASIFLYFYTSGGTIIGGSYNGSSNPTSTTTWTRVNVTAVAPATAAYADIVVYTISGLAGEIHYMDCLGIWEGTSLKWALPGETTTKNLLSPNMASVETDASEHGAWQATVARTTTAGQFTHGTAGLAVTATTANACNVETTGTAPLLIPVTAGKTYTTHVDIRSAAVATATVAVGVFWRDLAGNQVGNLSSTASAIGTAWSTKTHTWTAPPGAHSVQFLAIIRGTFAISDVFYMDRFGIWEGTSTTWNLPDSRMWLGKVKQSLNQSTARYQNISYYPQTFTAQQALANYKAYLGDVTGGSFSDAPGGRTLTDDRPKYYSNLWNSQTISV